MFANETILQELIEKRCAAMKAFDEYRTKRIEEYNSQKKRRLELRNGLYCNNIFLRFFSTLNLALLHNIKLLSAIDTDELDSDSKNVEEEVIEFFVKEETFNLDDK